MGSKKLTIEYVREQFKERGWSLLSDEYINNKSKLNYICDKGHENNINWNNFQNGYGCPNCAGQKKKTIKFIREKFQKKGWILLSTEYKNAFQKLYYICDKGHKNNIVWNNFQQGHGCPDCVGMKKKTIEFIRKEFKKEGYKLLSDEYKGSKIKLSYICPEGHCNSATWNSFQRGDRCSNCYFMKIRKTIEFIKEEFKKINYNLLNTEYKNNRIKLDYICDKGHKNSIRWTNFKQGCRCPDCVDHGFSPDKPAILYYIKLDCGLYKIGITNLSVKERYQKDDYKKFEYIYEKYYKKGKDAYNQEQKILKENKEFQYKGTDILKSGGNTELFTKNILKREDL